MARRAAARVTVVRAKVRADVPIVVPMAVCDDEHECDEALAKFLHEMGAKDTTAQVKLTVTPGSIPEETTTVRLEARGKV